MKDFKKTITNPVASNPEAVEQPELKALAVGKAFVEEFQK